MIILLMNIQDRSALWLHQQLAAQGLDIHTVLPEEILSCEKFTMQLSDGTNHSVIRLRKGLVIDSNNIWAVINRVNYLPNNFEKTFKKEDVDYVYQEWHAIFLGWLYGLREKIIFNKPSSSGLSGEKFTIEEWSILAVKAGFTLYSQMTTLETDPSSNRILSLICFHEQCIEYNGIKIPDTLRKICIKLQQLSAIEMIGVRILVHKEGVSFISATEQPDLTMRNRRLIELIEGALKKQTITTEMVW